MKRLTWIIIIVGSMIPAFTAQADSFGFYFRTDGFGMGMEFRDYDYYDRYSPDFYEPTEMDFYAALSPYGEWRYMEDFGGYIWIPAVSVEWQPYVYGSWTYTRYGWTWVSYEPWGWIPHHYGRWFFHPVYHWIWIPGYVWGPAYVSWGFYGGYYAWAPLPPAHCRYYDHYRYRRHRGYSRYDHNRYSYYENNYYDYSETNNTYYNYNYYNENNSSVGYERWIPQNAWVMVYERDFTSNDISAVRVRSEQTVSFIKSARFKKLKHAPSRTAIQQSTGRRIPVVKMDETYKYIDGKRVKVVRPSNILKKRETYIKKTREKVTGHINTTPRKTSLDGSRNPRNPVQKNRAYSHIAPTKHNNRTYSVEKPSRAVHHSTNRHSSVHKTTAPAPGRYSNPTRHHSKPVTTHHRNNLQNKVNHGQRQSGVKNKLNRRRQEKITPPKTPAPTSRHRKKHNAVKKNYKINNKNLKTKNTPLPLNQQ